MGHGRGGPEDSVTSVVALVFRPKDARTEEMRARHHGERRPPDEIRVRAAHVYGGSVHGRMQGQDKDLASTVMYIDERLAAEDGNIRWRGRRNRPPIRTASRSSITIIYRGEVLVGGTPVCAPRNARRMSAINSIDA